VKRRDLVLALALAGPLLAISCASPERASDAPLATTPYDSLVAALRSEDPEVRAAAADEAASAGIAAIPVLRQRALRPALPGHARTLGDAFESFTRDAIAAKDDAKRAAVANALLDVLDTELPALLRDDLVDQVGRLASDDATMARFAALLSRRETADAVRRALERSPHEASDRALVAALNAPDLPPRETIARIDSLGAKRSKSAVVPLLGVAAGRDVQIARAARRALARIGDPAASDALTAAFVPRELATCEDLLVFATRRAEAGDPAAAATLFAMLLDADAAHVRAAAAHGLSRVEPLLETPDYQRVLALRERLADGDLAVRVAAEAALAALSSPAVAALLRDTYFTGDDAIRPAALRILLAIDPRRDQVLAGALRDGSLAVRCEALAQATEEGRFDELVAIARDENGAESEVALEAALRVIERSLDDGARQVAASRLLAVAAFEPRGDAGKLWLRLAMRLGDPTLLPAVISLGADPDLASLVGATRVSLATRLQQGGDAEAARRELTSVLATAGTTRLRQSAIERLVRFGGDRTAALEAAGFVTDFHVIGPFPQATEDDFGTHPFGTAIDLGARHAGKEGEVAWRRHADPAFSGIVDLEDVIEPKDHCTAYAHARIDGGPGGKARLRVGSDDGVAIWLNGERVHQNFTFRGVRVDEDEVAVVLHAGVNELLVKVNQGDGGFGFAVRIDRGAERESPESP
jgi:HEAT repeat protein